MNSLETAFIAAGAVLYGPVTLVALLNLGLWRRERGDGSAPDASVSVLIPARNEEETLAGCVEAAVSQGRGLAEVLIFNDLSTDQTQGVIDSLNEKFPGIVRQVPERELPVGWVGKPHACQRLADHANSQWLLFVDADTRLRPGALDVLVAVAESRNATLLSAWPRIEMRSFAERFLMPLLNFVVFSLFPAPIARFRTGASLGLAHGACILAHRETYRRIGGHGLVQDRLFEDTALARAWRAHGENSQVTDGRMIATVRMYEDFEGIWDGFSKNYYPAFSSMFSFVAFQAFMAFSAVLFPAGVIALILTGVLSPLWLFLAAFSLISRLLIAIRFRHPLWSVLLHPFAVTVMLALGFRSWWLSEHGGGVSWKGRRYGGSRVAAKHE